MFKRNKQKEMILTYKRVFDTIDGGKVLRDLMNSCHFKNSTIGKTPEETAFNEGQRAVVLRIMNTLETSIEQLEKFYKHQEELEDDL